MRQEDGADISMIWFLPAFILPCAAAYRLAVFNLDTAQSKSFKGIPGACSRFGSCFLSADLLDPQQRLGFQSAFE